MDFSEGLLWASLVTELEQDRIFSRLDSMNMDYCKLRELVISSRMHLNVVMNPDKRAFSESLRIREKLAEINLAPSHVFLNKIRPEDEINHVLQAFKEVPVHRLAMAGYQVTGLDALSAYLEENQVFGAMISKDTPE